MLFFVLLGVAGIVAVAAASGSKTAAPIATGAPPGAIGGTPTTAENVDPVLAINPTFGAATLGIGNTVGVRALNPANPSVPGPALSVVVVAADGSSVTAQIPPAAVATLSALNPGNTVPAWATASGFYGRFAPNKIWG